MRFRVARTVLQAAQYFHLGDEPSVTSARRVALYVSDGDNASTPVYVPVAMVYTNDYAPVLVNPPATLSVSEGAPVGTVLAQLAATDTDAGPFGSPLTLALQPRSPLLAVNAQHQLVTTGQLDHEQQAVLPVVVAVRDQGGRASQWPITVLVLDANDHAPVFVQDSYTFAVDENTPMSTLVGRVQARDTDSAAVNGQLLYALDPAFAADAPLAVDARSGNLTLARALDYEGPAGPVLMVRVIARDQGEPPQVSEPIIVTLVVRDVDDHDPEWLLPAGMLQVDVPEDHVVGAVIAQLDAADADTLPEHTAMVITELARDPADAWPFELHVAPQNGSRATATLRLAVDLDREARLTYSTTLAVSHPTTGAGNATVQLHITVQDVNDNPPVVLLRANLQPQGLQENTPAGVLLAQVTASDADQGANAAVVFAVVASLPPGSVAITDAERGILATGPTPVDFEATHTMSATQVRLFVDRAAVPLQRATWVGLDGTTTVDTTRSDTMPFPMDDGPGVVTVGARVDALRGYTFFLAGRMGPSRRRLCRRLAAPQRR